MGSLLTVVGVGIFVCTTLILMDEIGVILSAIRIFAIMILSNKLSILLGQPIGDIIFYLSIFDLIILGVWVKVRIFKTDREEALEIEEENRIQREKELKVEKCYWSFNEDGERYCCKDGKIIKQSLPVCFANCKGFTKEDVLN